MRIVVNGRDGQVARALAEIAPARGHELVALGRPAFDLTAAPDEIANALAAVRPDVIVSAAAFTAVDQAEREPELAQRVNATGAGAVAAAAGQLGVPLVHLSTDYVFDGRKPAPYVEDDPTGPTGVYGRSKLAGEAAVLAAHDDVAILRTAWVFSPFGANFVKTMLRLAGDRDEVGVVADQLGNPTSALDLAAAILTVAENLRAGDKAEQRGIFHAAGTGDASWADFAERIFAASHARGGPTARVKRITTADFPTPATRPANSRLDCGKLARVHGVTMPDWRSSTDAVVERLLATTIQQGTVRP
jgi:dTDP-4-dehydrorhamnose reductase